MREPIQFRNLLPLSACALALASCTIDVSAAGCDLRAPRSATVDAAGARVVRIEARAGDLRVTGKPGLNQVAAEGTACAPDQDTLDQIELIAERRGDEVVLEARIPDGRGARHLDLEITVPESLAAIVHDSSGDATFENLASLDLRDSSGDVTLRGAAGDVSIEDSSGDLEIERVGGSLTVSDNSGDIEIDGVRGEVVVERDGSGDITARNVGKNFIVRSDGSGGIRAEDVAGDFVVERDGSGGVEFARVAGRTPTRRR
jgi:hypothetical protein